MAAEGSERISKEQRRRRRVRSALRQRWKRRLRRGAVAGALLALPGLWAYERSGPQQVVEAEVVETRRWRHVTPDRPPHPHWRAVLLIEGLTRVQLERADGYERGQRVPVSIRRGRLTGRPYFLDLVAAPEAAVPED